MRVILLGNGNYDIRRSRVNKEVPAYLVMEDAKGETIEVYFLLAGDLEDFVTAVSELEIANDTFNAEKEDT